MKDWIVKQLLNIIVRLHIVYKTKLPLGFCKAKPSPK